MSKDTSIGHLLNVLSDAEASVEDTRDQEGLDPEGLAFFHPISVVFHALDHAYLTALGLREELTKRAQEGTDLWAQVGLTAAIDHAWLPLAELASQRLPAKLLKELKLSMKHLQKAQDIHGADVANYRKNVKVASKTREAA